MTQEFHIRFSTHAYYFSDRNISYFRRFFRKWKSPFIQRLQYPRETLQLFAYIPWVHLDNTTLSSYIDIKLMIIGHTIYNELEERRLTFITILILGIEPRYNTKQLY